MLFLQYANTNLTFRVRVRSQRAWDEKLGGEELETELTSHGQLWSKAESHEQKGHHFHWKGYYSAAPGVGAVGTPVLCIPEVVGLDQLIINQ